MPRAQFRFFPGINNTRAVCAECYAKIVAEPSQKVPIPRSWRASLSFLPRTPHRVSTSVRSAPSRGAPELRSRGQGFTIHRRHVLAAWCG